MKTFVLSLLTVGLLATATWADIINGGFETNNFSGWTTTGQTNITNAGFDARTNNALSTVAPGLGTHSARVGDQDAYGYVGSSSSSISQTWTKSSTFDHLYFAWAAVGLIPTNITHTVPQTPWFQINLFDTTTNATIFSQEYYTGNLTNLTPGWLRGATQTSSLGQNSDGIWYYRPWETFDLNLASIMNGDILRLTLTTRDCTLSGHASYAYLDGFGSTPPPIDPVPEPSTVALLGLGLAGIAYMRKRMRK